MAGSDATAARRESNETDFGGCSAVSGASPRASRTEASDREDGMGLRAAAAAAAANARNSSPTSSRDKVWSAAWAGAALSRVDGGRSYKHIKTNSLSEVVM